jgi:hypothetical protein
MDVVLDLRASVRNVSIIVKCNIEIHPNVNSQVELASYTWKFGSALRTSEPGLYLRVRSLPIEAALSKVARRHGALVA